MASGMVTLSLVGFDVLERKLKEFPPKIARKYGAQALRAGARIIIDAARPHIPVGPKDHPHLEDSLVFVNKRMPGAGPDQINGRIAFKEPAGRRAHWVEYGTYRMPAQPFMRPALAAHSEDAIARIGEVLFEAIITEAV